MNNPVSDRQTAHSAGWHYETRHSGFGFIDLIIPGLHKANGICGY